MGKRKYSTGAKWEDIVGYSRSVRIGNIIEVSGTTSVKDGMVYGIGDPFTQAKHILSIIEDAIQKLGGTMDDVIKTRIYVTDIDHWSEVGRAHGEVFGEIKPTTLLIEVKGLVDPDMLVEIEATAVVSE
ncbi:MAG: RidA family protein [Saprospiraceae bacterium]|nr:RidA family protein [Saprospiraceae bacterium]